MKIRGFSSVCLCLPVVLALSLFAFRRIHAFVLPPSLANRISGSTSLALASPSKRYESEEEMNRRMELVRNLQETYYKSENGPAPTLDESTGIVTNLPLWRVSWTELPGRANVLNVHEPMYTNMFETILNRPPHTWYVGHLFLPGGSNSLRSGDDRYQLKSWQDYYDCSTSQHHDGIPAMNARTAVVGTLMKIVDFRRLQDGRLCILVHAMERFVVQDAIQNLPYSIANVQILPDYEQLSTAVDTLEDQAAFDRATAIVQSFQYHAYEYKETPLPLSREKKYFSLQDTYGSWLSDLLPFAPYYLDHSLLPDNTTPPVGMCDAPTTLGVELSLETRLLNKAIVQNPPGVQRTGLSNDELEAQLWNALEDYCTAKGIQLPDPVLALLPPGRSWFRVPHVWYRRVADAGRYPAQRRQARLSYAAAYFLEQTDVGRGMRQMWLETPTTNARLADLCERFDIVNADLHIGEFQ